jgi:hypothetical protein
MFVYAVTCRLLPRIQQLHKSSINHNILSYHSVKQDLIIGKVWCTELRQPSSCNFWPTRFTGGGVGL